MPGWTLPPVLMILDSRMQRAHWPLGSISNGMRTRGSPLPRITFMTAERSAWVLTGGIRENQALPVVEAQLAGISAKVHLNMNCWCLLKSTSPRPLSRAPGLYLLPPLLLSCGVWRAQGVCHWGRLTPRARLPLFSCISFPSQPSHYLASQRDRGRSAYSVIQAAK